MSEGIYLPNFQTPAHQRREVYVANYYLVQHPDKFSAAQVDEYDFFACPDVAEWWTRAKKLVDDGKTWTFLDLFAAWEADDASAWKQQKYVIDASKEYYFHTPQMPAYQRKMTELTSLRRVYEEMRTTANMIEGGANCDDIMVHADRMVTTLRESNSEGWVRLKDASNEAAKSYVLAVDGKETPTIEMPLKLLQKQLRGWPLGTQVMILGLTSGHKTTLARMSAVYHAKNGGCAAYISMEDSPQHLAARTLADEGDGSFTVEDLMTGAGSEEALRGLIKAADKIEEKDPSLWIFHGCLTITKLICKIHEAAAKGATLIAIDFFQLIEPDPGDRRTDTEHWKFVSNKLRNAAHETGACIVNCIQPDKAASIRAQKLGEALTSSDARGGSAIDQAAFGFLTLSFDYTEERERVPGLIYINIEKWKSSKRDVSLKFGVDGAYDRIYDLGEEKTSFYS